MRKVLLSIVLNTKQLGGGLRNKHLFSNVGVIGDLGKNSFREAMEIKIWLEMLPFQQ